MNGLALLTFMPLAASYMPAQRAEKAWK